MVKKCDLELYEKHNKDEYKRVLSDLNVHNTTEKAYFEELSAVNKRIKKGTISVKYSYKLKGRNDNYGRLYADGCCYQTMKNSLRGHFCNKDYVGIDISNCHPRLLKDLFSFYKIECPELANYVNNRQSVVEQFDIDKSFVNSLCNNEIYIDKKFADSDAEYFKNIHTKLYTELLPKLEVDYPELVKLSADNKIKKNLKDNKERSWNIKGAFIANFLMTLENKIILECVDRIKKQFNGVDSIIHDEILVNKTEDIDSICAVLKNVCMNSQFLNIPFNFEILFKKNVYTDFEPFKKKSDEQTVQSQVKKFDDILDVPDSEKTDIVFSKDTRTTYAYFKKEFEKSAFYCTKDKQVVFTGFCDGLFMSDNTVPALFNSVGKVKEYANILRYYEHLDDKEKPVYHYVKWLNEEITKRAYFQYDFLPEPIAVPDDTYNLWHGFKRKEFEYNEQLKNRALQIHKNFMNHIGLCHKGVSEYIEMWIANILQKPGFKEGILPILLGEEGTWKNTFVKYINALIGREKCIEVADADKILGRFNQRLMKALFVCFNEAVSYDMIQKSGMLKSLITDTTFSYEEKGKPIIEGHNFSRVVICTNENIGAKSSSSDRRNIHIETYKMPDNLRMDVYELIESEEMMNYVFQYLKNDLKVIYKNQKEWQENRPITDKTKEVIEHFIDPVYKVINTYISKEPIVVTFAKIFEDYDSMCTFEGKTLKSRCAVGLVLKKLQNDSKFIERCRVGHAASYAYRILPELKNFLMDKNLIQKSAQQVPIIDKVDLDINHFKPDFNAL